MSDCLFCKIIAGELPSERVGESDHCIAFNDIDPKAPTHVLIVPKKHYASMTEVPDGSVIGAMSSLAKTVAKEAGLVESGYRLVINTGKHGGQTVDHVHLHLLGGRKLKWPPG